MRKSTLKIIVYITAILILLCFFGMILFKNALNIYQYEERLKEVQKVLHQKPENDDKLRVDGGKETTGDVFTFDNKIYKVFCQFANDYKGYNKYLKSHGCAACSLTTILVAYKSECSDWTPYEAITIAEKNVVDEVTMKSNYSKSPSKQMPISMYGISKVLDYYRIDHEYVIKLGNVEDTKQDIIKNLEKGDPVIFVVSQTNRATGEKSSKWTGSYHTMVMIGMVDEGKVLIANPAGKRRLSIVSLEEMVNYMFSCSEEPDSFYWTKKSKCGGYIKVLY